LHRRMGRRTPGTITLRRVKAGLQVMHFSSAAWFNSLENAALCGLQVLQVAAQEARLPIAAKQVAAVASRAVCHLITVLNHNALHTTDACTAAMEVSACTKKAADLRGARLARNARCDWHRNSAWTHSRRRPPCNPGPEAHRRSPMSLHQCTVWPATEPDNTSQSQHLPASRAPATALAPPRGRQ